MRSNQNTGKMTWLIDIKRPYTNYWKDLVVDQNLTSPKNGPILMGIILGFCETAHPHLPEANIFP